MKENLNTILKIDKETYKIDNKNFHGVKYKKSQIILGGSLRKENYHIKHLQKKDFGLTKEWPTFSISREGMIYQHYNPECYSDYMKVKEMDKKSISIVLENMGTLYYYVEDDGYRNWINEVCTEDKVFEKLWKNYRYWETYTSQQYDALVILCNHLFDEYDIKRDCIGFNVISDNAENFNGIICRSNYNSDYLDLNPSFQWKKLLKGLGISMDK